MAANQVWSPEVWGPDAGPCAVLGQLLNAAHLALYQVFQGAFCKFKGKTKGRNRPHSIASSREVMDIPVHGCQESLDHLRDTFLENFAAAVDRAAGLVGTRRVRPLGLLTALPPDLPCCPLLEPYEVPASDPRVGLRGEQGVRVCAAAPRGLRAGDFVAVYRGHVRLGNSEFARFKAEGCAAATAGGAPRGADRAAELQIESYAATTEDLPLAEYARANGIALPPSMAIRPQDQLFVSAYGAGNIGCLINDPEVDPLRAWGSGQVRPDNVCMCEVRLGAWPWLVMFASRAVAPGEELRYAYGQSFWNIVREKVIMLESVMGAGRGGGGGGAQLAGASGRDPQPLLLPETEAAPLEEEERETPPGTELQVPTTEDAGGSDSEGDSEGEGCSDSATGGGGSSSEEDPGSVGALRTRCGGGATPPAQGFAALGSLGGAASPSPGRRMIYSRKTPRGAAALEAELAGARGARAGDPARAGPLRLEPAAAAAASRQGRPASGGLPAREVMVAKTLTASDVRGNLINLHRRAARAHPVLRDVLWGARDPSFVDHAGQAWTFSVCCDDFTYKLELSGTRQYVRQYGLTVGDTIAFSRPLAAPHALMVEFNTPEALAQAEAQGAAPPGGAGGAPEAGGGDDGANESPGGSPGNPGRQLCEGLPPRTLVVAKALCRSDTHQACVLPRLSRGNAALEAVLPPDVSRVAVPFVDHTGRTWQFVFSRRADGSAALTRAVEYMRQYGLGVGDTIAISRTLADRRFAIEFNTPEALAQVEAQEAARAAQEAAAVRAGGGGDAGAEEAAGESEVEREPAPAGDGPAPVTVNATQRGTLASAAATAVAIAGRRRARSASRDWCISEGLGAREVLVAKTLGSDSLELAVTSTIVFSRMAVRDNPALRAVLPPNSKSGLLPFEDHTGQAWTFRLGFRPNGAATLGRTLQYVRQYGLAGGDTIAISRTLAAPRTMIVEFNTPEALAQVEAQEAALFDRVAAAGLELPPQAGAADGSSDDARDGSGGAAAAAPLRASAPPRQPRRAPLQRRPVSEGMPAREVLVAKTLTRSDASSAALVLSTVAARASPTFRALLPQSVGCLDLPCLDHAGRSWPLSLSLNHFSLLSLSGFRPYVRQYGLVAGDTVAISRALAAPHAMAIEFNTPEASEQVKKQEKSFRDARFGAGRVHVAPSDSGGGGGGGESAGDGAGMRETADEELEAADGGGAADNAAPPAGEAGPAAERPPVATAGAAPAAAAAPGAQEELAAAKARLIRAERVASMFLHKLEQCEEVVAKLEGRVREAPGPALPPLAAAPPGEQPSWRRAAIFCIFDADRMRGPYDTSRLGALCDGGLPATTEVIVNPAASQSAAAAAAVEGARRVLGPGAAGLGTWSLEEVLSAACMSLSQGSGTPPPAAPPPAAPPPGPPAKLVKELAAAKEELKKAHEVYARKQEDVKKARQELAEAEAAAASAAAGERSLEAELEKAQLRALGKRPAAEAPAMKREPPPKALKLGPDGAGTSAAHAALAAREEAEAAVAARASDEPVDDVVDLTLLDD